VAAGALSAIAAHGAPGRTHAPKGASSAGNGPIGLQPPAGGSQQGGDVSGSGLQPPVGAPGPVPGGGGSGQVVSGGS
jgi:hypothetical protein